MEKKYEGKIKSVKIYDDKSAEVDIEIESEDFPELCLGGEFTEADAGKKVKLTLEW